MSPEGVASADGPASVSELAEAADLQLNGHVSSDLKDLCAAGFVASSDGLNPSTGKPARETRYRLRDNYIRFYLKFIRPKKAAIRSGMYKFKSMENLAGWDTALVYEGALAQSVQDNGFFDFIIPVAELLH